MPLAVHAHHQHVHVVEAAQPVVGMELLLLAGQILDGLPGVEDVPCGAPHGSPRGLDPLVGLVYAPGAGGEQDVAPAVLQGQPHAPVQILSGDDGAVVAVVVFQEIHAPLRKGLRVDELMLEAARVPGTGQVPRTGIHAEFQTFGVDIVRHCLHAVGELLRIRHQAALPVPLLHRPAIIDDQVLVALLRQPLLHHGVRRLINQLLIDVLPKGVPGIPPHGRCQFHHIDCPPYVLTGGLCRQANPYSWIQYKSIFAVWQG